ncbi:MAG TPA: hypothetical protein VJJ24_00430 [Candidatus Paceibacterota bacterium]
MSDSQAVKRPRISVEKQGNESSIGLLKRFNKKVTSSSILKTARAGRYRLRPTSLLQKKKRALKRIAKYKVRMHLVKLGKLVLKPRGRR